MGSQASVANGSTGDDYVVRRYGSADRDGVLALDRIVWGRDRGESWFDWKYERNPYLDEVPVFVAERDGVIVGARPLLGYPLRIGDETALALQPSDTMVHPDHRRNGLFTRMTARAVEEYARGPPRLLFNYPNETARSGYLSLGWNEVGPRRTYYRVQNPGTFIDGRLDGPLGAVLARTVTPALVGADRAHRWARSASSTSVWRVEGAPVGVLASLYRRRIPAQIHAARDERFLRWRFGSPMWERSTYVARRGGELVAAVVLRRRTNHDGVAIAQLADVVPLSGDRGWYQAMAALVDRALADCRDADLIAFAGTTLPASLLLGRGFLPDDRPPLSWFTTSRTMVSRLLGDDRSSPTRAERALADRSNWLYTFIEYDTT